MLQALQMGFTMADCKPSGFEWKTSGLIVVPIV
jgi:hypothetical protein